MTKSEEVKLNIRQISLGLGIIVICSGAIAAGAIAIDRGSRNSVKIVDLEKVDDIVKAELAETKLEFATFKGAIGERTRAIQEDQKIIMADIKKLLENLELSDG